MDKRWNQLTRSAQPEELLQEQTEIDLTGTSADMPPLLGRNEAILAIPVYNCRFPKCN